ncbi:hypothetical protein PVAP13_5NG042008 [Panicum virgatum]|uniref:Uncharacterized protein n=1 Tax=Panicum virgatum TaxID=38727 RepID=A0A8T0RNR5_PANVG|nr:hypothetical protein PVAP13_5NG042008 [Panicum virgatum]
MGTLSSPRSIFFGFVQAAASLQLRSIGFGSASGFASVACGFARAVSAPSTRLRFGGFGSSSTSAGLRSGSGSFVRASASLHRLWLRIRLRPFLHDPHSLLQM